MMKKISKLYDFLKENVYFILIVWDFINKIIGIFNNNV